MLYFLNVLTHGTVEKVSVGVFAFPLIIQSLEGNSVHYLLGWVPYTVLTTQVGVSM